MRRNPSHKVYERRWKEHARQLSAEAINARLFIGKYPCGLVYADRSVEEGGDYKKLAFLPYHGLKLETYCPRTHPLYEAIKRDAATVQALAGQEYQVSSCGQTVRLTAESEAR